MYPVGSKFVPLLDQGGAIFGPAVDQALKCVYPFDGTSMTRPNRGCGCQSLIFDVCAPNKEWHCPTTLNTCSDRDPQSPSRKPFPINENSSVLSACQCTQMGITEMDDPLFYGIYAPGTPKCVWSGPSTLKGKAAMNSAKPYDSSTILGSMHCFRGARLFWMGRPTTICSQRNHPKQ